jgi:hypothetical protein
VDGAGFAPWGSVAKLAAGVERSAGCQINLILEVRCPRGNCAWKTRSPYFPDDRPAEVSENLKALRVATS